MKQLEKVIIAMYADAGKQWLAALPERVTKLAVTWNVTELQQVKDLSYNYVMTGVQGNNPIVLKLGMDEAALEREACALQVYDGVGAVRVLGALPGALLLEQALPGTSLKTFFPHQERDACAIFVRVMNRLHQGASGDATVFPHVKEWLSVLDDDRCDIPQEYKIRARELRDVLLESTQQEVLLHGDLHHDNILEQNGDWVAIDPKGVIGDPMFEYAAFVRNPWPSLIEHDQVQKLIRERLNYLTADPERVLCWSFVQSILSWIWACQDGVYDDSFKRFTELLYGILTK